MDGGLSTEQSAELRHFESVDRVDVFYINVVITIHKN